MKTLRKKYIPCAQRDVGKCNQADDWEKKLPHKVLHYFPLGPRLKHLFATSRTAKFIGWHHMGKSIDNDVMRHPVDGRAWQEFDKSYPQFSNDVRDIRLGLAADGFNPFGNMSFSYSMWLVVLTTYNPPLWLNVNFLGVASRVSVFSQQENFVHNY